MSIPTAKSRVVILSAFLTPFRSGAEACVEEVALRLAHKYDITIVTSKLRRDLPRRSKIQDPRSKQDSTFKIQDSPSMHIIRVGIGFGIDKWLYPFLAPIAVRRLKPKLTHAVLETFAGLALRFCPGKKLLTLQTTNRSFLKSSIIKSADRVTAISDVLLRQASEAGVRAEKIPNGINNAAFEEARRKHPKVRGRILFVGRLEKIKGVDTLLAAFAELRVKSCELRVVGSGSQRQSLEALSKKLGIAERVAFLGHVPADRIAKEYAEAEIFCGLSRSEALGNVFLEAQASGCAVVATNVGGIPDIVRDGETGLLVLPDGPQAAASAIRTLLDDPALRERLSSAGEAHAKAYDWNLIAPRYVAVYEHLLVRT